MKKFLFLGVLALAAIFPGMATATPSTQIWIPSTDIQGSGVFHLGADVYSTPMKGFSDGGHNVVNYGLTVGILPESVAETFGIEVGVDYRDLSGNSKNPIYLNAKLGLKEGAFGEISPAIAVGAYDFGTKSSTSDTDASDFRTDSNIIYGLVAKTFGMAGRFSIGYFSGNDKLLTDSSGKKANTGLLASWDKTISDKWWVALDYMGGKSAYGAISFGVAYMVSPESSFIVGYDIFSDPDIGGKSMNSNTVTFQYDVNL